jgi:hypothetical protein
VPAVSVKKHWCFIPYTGTSGWYNRGGMTTVLTAVDGSNAEWEGKPRVTAFNATTLIVRIKFKKFKEKKVTDPVDGTVTVTLTNIDSAQAPDKTQVIYDGDDPDTP